MPLLRTRPKIRLRVPRSITPAQPFLLDVLLDAKEQVDVDMVSVTIVGRVSVYQHSREIVRLRARPNAPRPLPSGTTSLSVHAELPGDVPPTYRGTNLRVDWEVEVHASVPWWPDAHGRFEIHVVPVPVEHHDPTTLFATRDGGPKDGEPYAELSVASRTMTPGGVLRGAIAVYGTATHSYQRATLTLRALEGALGSTWSGPGWTIQVPLAGALEGDAVPFAIGIPDLVPSFRTPHGALGWQLGVEVQTTWSKVLSFDVPMFVGKSRASQTTADALPPLGEERVRRVWIAVAEREGMRLDGSAIVRDVGAVRVAVHRGRGPRGGPELVATLTYPALGLDLRLGQRTMGARMFGTGVKTGIEAFDAAYVVTGRSEEQIATWMPAVGQATYSLGLRAAWMDDGTLKLIVADPGTTEKALAQLVRSSIRLAELLDTELARVPLPPGLEREAAALEEIATAVGGTLERGHARIAGMRDDAKVELTTMFDEKGSAIGLRFEVEPETGLRLDAPIVVVSGAVPDALGAEARRLCERLGATELALDATRVVAVYLRSPLGPRLASAVATFDACLTLARTIRGEGGPFR